MTDLVKTLWWRHGSLDGQATNVLPALFQQGDQVVDSQHDVTDQLILGHTDIADSDTHAENLFELEFDGGLDIGDLVGEILSVGDWGWEFASLGETRTEETRNLLDEGIGRDESIVLACELFDQLLVLVELLQVVGAHGIDAVVLGTIDVVLVTEDADGHAWTWDLWELDGSGETLVTLGVIVLQAYLEFNGLEKIPLFRIIGVLEDFFDVGTHAGDSYLGGHDFCLPEN